MKMQSTEKLTPFQLIIIVLSIYVLCVLLVTSLFHLPANVMTLVEYIDNCICVVFLADFIYRFWRAENRMRFMRWGWLDLVSSIPMLNYARAGRALRLIRLLRILRAFRSARALINHIFRTRAQGAFTTALIIAILMLLFTSLAILQVEAGEDSNIRSAEDALWWAFTTITTVGYGDKFPVTTEGRIIAAFLMSTGVGLFGVFTAYIASLFVEHKNDKQDLLR